MGEKKRIEYFDVMRLIMCLGVCWSHAIGGHIVAITNQIAHTPWLFGLFGQTFVRICVSIFLMISGALLLKSEKNTSIKYVYKHRVLKWVLLLIIWSGICYAVRSAIGEFTPSVSDFVHRLLTNGFISSYWYLYTLIFLMLVLPVMTAIALKCERKHIWLMVIIGMITVYVPSFASKAFGLEITVFYRVLSGSYIPIIFFLGYLLTQEEIPAKIRGVIYVIGIFCFAMTFYLASQMYDTGSYDNTWLMDDGLFVLGMVVAFFVFCRYAKIMTRISRFRIVKWGASLSLGIYLVHQMMIRVYLYLNPIRPDEVTILYILKYYGSIVGIAAAVALVLYVIPGVKKLVT